MNYRKEIKTRLFWLIIGLGLSLGIAEVIKGFENTLAENLILASFIPLIVYMSDAVGTQMESIIIRELNVRKKSFNFKKFIFQQGIIVLVVAIIIGLIAGALVTLINQSLELGLAIGLSLAFGIISSLVTGSVLPYMFWKLHNDPAEASGPIATALQDFLSVLIFFTVANFLL